MLKEYALKTDLMNDLPYMGQKTEKISKGKVNKRYPESQ